MTRQAFARLGGDPHFREEHPRNAPDDREQPADVLGPAASRLLRARRGRAFGAADCSTARPAMALRARLLAASQGDIGARLATRDTAATCGRR